MPRLDDRRLLLIEDEPLISAFVEDALVEEGAFVVGHAASLAEAEDMLLRLHPDGVLLDLNLHGVSALPLADRLHELHLPFIVTTGYDTEAMPPGLAEEVLVKPYDLPLLVAAVQRMYAAPAPALPVLRPSPSWVACR